MLSTAGRRTGLWRLGAAAVAAVIVAEAAAWLLRPRDDTIEPVTVAERDYFSEAQIERAQDYNSGQRLLFFATIAIEGSLLVVLAVGRPRFVRRRLGGLARRPLLGAAAAGAALSLTLTVATLPTAAIAHERSVDYGISTQGFGSWLSDQGKMAAIGAVFAAAAATLLIGLLRRFGRMWWIPGAVVVVALGALFSWLAPVVLAPIFNRFEPLPAGRARSDVLELGGRAGVDIGEVYEVDASRRSRALNAYVTGLGSTKRVVLYDTLLDKAREPELRSVVAHELGHVKHRDILRGIAWVAIVAPLALVFAGELGRRLAARSDADPATPAALPAFALALAVTAFALGVVGNQLSREVEASADSFALEQTDDPRGLIRLQTQLTRTNLGDPDPPGWVTFLFGTHPTTVERIGAAVAWQSGERP
jgi:Zn-dependent protease with chaperone function